MTDTACACRSCGKTGLTTILSFGSMPLANALLTADQLHKPELTYPLELVLCPHCALVQITETVPPDILFREYLYFSSYSDTMLRHSKELVGRLVAQYKLGPNSLVVEPASNDGYLLQYYKQAGVPVLGIEPARNVALVAEEKHGIPTLCEFFGEALAQQLKEQGKRADVIHAHNVLAHVADLNGFLRAIRLLLKDNGIAVIEAPYVKDMVDCCEFDTIYHEHLCYFSLTALSHLCQRSGLTIQDVEHVPIHGGSLRLFVVRAGSSIAGPKISPAVTALLSEEESRGVNQWQFYADFTQRAKAARDRLWHLLGDLSRSGKRLAAYGAAAKGTTLLNYCRIGQDTLDFVVDRSTYKQGHFMPGVRLPIYPPEMLLQEMPEYVLLLTWNFAEEIMRQQDEYRRRGGRFIIPIPNVEVV